MLLDFDTKDVATVFLERLRSQVWDNPEVSGQLTSAAPTARILEEPNPQSRKPPAVVMTDGGFAFVLSAFF